MGQSLRRSCPCLETLWWRIYPDKTFSPGREGDGGEGGGGRDVGEKACSIYGEEEESARSPAPPTPPERDVETNSIYAAMWPFEARIEGELTFKEGDRFNVMSRSGDWWTAQKIDKDGRVLVAGLVPNNYLSRARSLKSKPWFFGTMSRLEAQKILLGPENEEGAFLIRQSEKDDVGFVLSVRSSTKVKHYKITQGSDENFHVESKHQFSSLNDLVEHYTKNSLINTGRLSSHCRRKKPNTPELDQLAVDEWEFPKDQFTLGKKLGGGNFGDVYRGQWKKSINVAIKILKKEYELNCDEFQREVQMLKTLRHPHLISLFAVCTSSKPYYIITELMEKGSLLDFLRGPEGKELDTPILIDMAAQVADGMSYLEEQNSIHRDLAARNVLVGKDYVCKVADFGLARVIKEGIYISGGKKIPYKWTAPEALSHGTFSIKSDVWSFGVLLYEIITHGGIPYAGFSNNREVQEQVTAGYRMPAPAKCPDLLYQIMLLCWNTEPDKRPDFKFLKTQLNSNFGELA